MSEIAPTAKRIQFVNNDIQSIVMHLKLSAEVSLNDGDMRTIVNYVEAIAFQLSRRFAEYETLTGGKR